jgi:hypothetical protein
MKINNALGFAGFLHGWDAETEQQRRRTEEDRVRQNNQDMFGISQALGNLRVGEQQRLDELGQFTQPAKLAQLTESQDNHFTGSPLRKASNDFNRTVETAQLDARKQTYPENVMGDLFTRREASRYNNIMTGINVSNSNSEADLFSTLAKNMNQLNAADSLKKLQLDDSFKAVRNAAGSVMIQPVNDPSRLIPLAVFQNSVLDSKGAYNAVQSDISDIRKGNAATSVLNAKAGQTNNKVTFQGLTHLFDSYSKLLVGMETNDPRYANTQRKLEGVEKLILEGSHAP